jgi:hypothetical protein
VRQTPRHSLPTVSRAHRATSNPHHPLLHFVRPQGFDEYMNIVLDSVEEVSKSKRGGAQKRKPLGRLLLKGDNICAVCQAGVAPAGSASSAAVDSRAASAAADALPAAAAEAAPLSGASAAGAEGEGEAGAPSSKRPRRGNA